MRAPVQTAPAPRLRALGPTLRRAQAPAPAPAPGGVFRDCVATLERLERGKRRKPGTGGKDPA
jgi:hypothetical protein